MPGIEQLSVAVAVPVLAGSVLAVHCIVTFDGHKITGGVLSSTVMVCIHVDVLPHPSVADQVRVIVNSWAHAPATITSLEVMTGTEQLSVAVAEPVLAASVLAVHSMVTFPGHEITGGVLSSTVIVCIQVDVLPHPSVADQVLVIVRSCGHPPASVTSLKVIAGEEQLSVAEAEPVTAGSVLTEHCIVTLDGHEITGGVVSSTVIVWIHVEVLPHPSVADHVLVIVRSCGQAPATVTSLKVIPGVEQISVAEADPVLAGSVLAVH